MYTLYPMGTYMSKTNVLLTLLMKAKIAYIFEKFNDVTSNKIAKCSLCHINRIISNLLS